MPDLKTWVSEFFFEENPLFSRRPSRLMAVLVKILRPFPHALMFLHTNFGGTYARSPRRITEPVARKIPTVKQLVIGAKETAHYRRWPRVPGSLLDRGLPFSDDTVESVVLARTLSRVGDVGFVMREVHRVCAPGAAVFVEEETLPQQMRLADPAQKRCVSTDTVLFFTDHGTSSEERFEEDRDLAGLFELVTCSGEENVRVQLRARKPEERPVPPHRLDLGSGPNPRPDFTGVDIVAFPNVIVRDIERHGLPFSDSTITHIHTAHFLEHVRDLTFVMNEIHRVCCHDAIVTISVPTLLGPYAAADPTHVRLFNARAFSYFEPRTGEELRGQIDYAGIRKGFEILSQRVGFSLEVTLRVEKGEQTSVSRIQES